MGIQPDIIIGRCEEELPEDLKRKIALFCDVDQDAVFTGVDVKSIYEVPLKFYEEGVDQKIAILLKLPAKNAELEPWETLNYKLKNPKGAVKIGIIGKYVDLTEAYKSLHEALVHGGVANDVKVELEYVNSEKVNLKNVEKKLKDLDGILVPGGFGSAAWKARSCPSSMHERTAFRSSASVWVCSVPVSSSPETSSAWKGPTPRNSTRIPRTTSST